MWEVHIFFRFFEKSIFLRRKLKTILRNNDLLQYCREKGEFSYENQCVQKSWILSKKLCFLFEARKIEFNLIKRVKEKVVDEFDRSACFRVSTTLSNISSYQLFCNTKLASQIQFQKKNKNSTSGIIIFFRIFVRCKLTFGLIIGGTKKFDPVNLYKVSLFFPRQEIL